MPLTAVVLNILALNRSGPRAAAGGPFFL